MDLLNFLSPVLQQEQDRLTQTNPWIGAGRGLQNFRLAPNTGGSGWEQVLAQTIAQGLGGLASGYGQEQSNRQYTDMTQKLAQTLGGANSAEAMANDPLLARFAPYAQANQNQQLQDLQSRANLGWLDQKLQNPYGVGATAPTVAMDSSGRPTIEFEAAPEMTSAEAGQMNIPAPEVAPIQQPGQLNFGSEVPSVDKAFEAAFNANLQRGMKPDQASVRAAEQVKGLRKSMEGSFDESKAAREYAQKMLMLADTAEAGLQGAGYTGPGESALRLGSMAQSYLPDALGGSSAADKVAATGLLESIKPELIKMNRSPGAVSDFESRMYLAAGPSASNTPETNKVLIDRMRELGKINADYADFLETYRQKTGTNDGAGKSWRQYTQANPLFIKDQTGQLTLNKDRTPWQQFFATPAETGVGQVRTTKDGRSWKQVSPGNWEPL